MAVYRPSKDSSIWWYDFVFEGQRVRESAKTRSKTLAKDSERVRRRELEEGYNGIKRRDRAKLFSVAADEWLVLKSFTLAASSQRIDVTISNIFAHNSRNGLLPTLRRPT